MKYILENILEIVVASVVVVVLLWFILSANINGKTGILARLSDNPYRNIDNDISENGLTDAYINVVSAAEDAATIAIDLSYHGGTLRAYNSETGANHYDVRNLIRIIYEGNTYVWQEDAGSYVNAASPAEALAFQVYVEDIKDSKRESVLSLGTLEENLADIMAQEQISEKVLYSDDTQEIVFFDSGQYFLYLTISQKDSGASCTKRVGVPVIIDL